MIERIIKDTFITFVSKKIANKVVTKPPVIKITISGKEIKSYETNETSFFLSRNKKSVEKGKLEFMNNFSSLSC